MLGVGGCGASDFYWVGCMCLGGSLRKGLLLLVRRRRRRLASRWSFIRSDTSGEAHVGQQET